ncbi:MAG: sodium:proton antiporter [Pseudomonadota bacterium]
MLGGIIVAVLISGSWDPGIYLTLSGIDIPLQMLARDVALIMITLTSLVITPKRFRDHNHFHWFPMIEVAKLFAGIFITIIPVIAILKAGLDGTFAPLITMVQDETGAPNNMAYFWITGTLSAFLDNAPTYLVFFNLAGGDPQALMGPLATTLLAISAGAVFMGAFTYIGNAPNFLVRSIAEDQGVAMPSFFGYIGWSSIILLPILALVSVIYFYV